MCLKNLIADINSGKVRIGVVAYGKEANVEFYLNEYNRSSAILKHIEEIEWMGPQAKTNTSGGIRVMYMDVFNMANGEHICAIFFIQSDYNVIIIIVVRIAIIILY